MNNPVFENTMNNARNHRDIKLVITNKGRHKLASEANYHSTNRFSGKLLAIKMNKTNIKMKKPVYLGLPILYMSKIAMVWLLVLLHKTKVWRQDKSMLHWYEEFQSSNKIRRHLCRPCRRCQNKISHIQL